MGPLGAGEYLWLAGCSGSAASTALPRLLRPPERAAPSSRHAASAPSSPQGHAAQGAGGKGQPRALRPEQLAPAGATGGARRSAAAVSVPRARDWSPAAGRPRGASPGGPAPRPAAPPGPHRWLPAPAAPRGRATAALLLLLTCRRSRAGRAGGRAPGSLGAAVPPAPRGAVPQAGRGPPAAGRWASLRPLGEPPPRRPAAIFRGQGAREAGEERPHRHRHRHAPGPGGAGPGPGPAAGGDAEGPQSTAQPQPQVQRCSWEQRYGGWGIVQPLPPATPPSWRGAAG